MFCSVQPAGPGGGRDGDLPAGDSQHRSVRPDLKAANTGQQDEDPRLGQGEEGGGEEEGGDTEITCT